MLYAIVAVIALILDQAMKYWTTSNIALNVGEKAFIPGFLHLTNVHNTGAAFSFLEGARWFFVVLCLVFVAVIIYVLVKNIINTPMARWMSVLVMAGAVGNCIDRVISGYVVDMFEFEFMTFPVFNLADIFITVGGIAFCLCILLEKPQTKAVFTAESSPATAKVTPTAPVKQPAPSGAVVSQKPVAPSTPKKSGRKHQKVEIPQYPKRPPVDDPAINPNDPFAEWERRANATAPKANVNSSPASAPSAEKAQRTSFTGTSQQVPKVSQPATPAKAAATKAQPPVQPVRTPAAPKQTAQPATIQPAASENLESYLNEDFDLDSILAEFKDL